MLLKICKGGINRAGPIFVSIREKTNMARTESNAVAIISLGRSVTSKWKRKRASLAVLPPCRCAIMIKAAAAVYSIVSRSLGRVLAILISSVLISTKV